MSKKKILYIVIGVIFSVVMVLLFLVYLPLLNTHKTLNSNFNFANGRENFNFNDNLIDLDKNQKHEYLYLKSNVKHPLNPEFVLIIDEKDIEGQNIVSIYLIKLKRDSIFDLSWAVNYPIKHDIIYKETYDYFINLNGCEELSDFLNDSNNVKWSNLPTPSELAEQKNSLQPPQDTNIYYGYTVEEYLEKLNQLNPEQKEDVTNFVADNMDKFTDGSPKLVIKYMIDQGYLEAK